VTTRSTESLYAIIDAGVAEDPVALGRRAVTARCAMLQLRAKRLDDRSFVDVAAELRAACREARIPFVVNDRADIARIVHADGLHLGQTDLRVADARRVVGSMQIGVSTHDLHQARQAQREGADLIALGPIFETWSKDDPDPVVGLARLAEVCRRIARPVVAIGGITPENAVEAIRQGASYVAVISALPRFLGAE